MVSTRPFTTIFLLSALGTATYTECSNSNARPPESSAIGDRRSRDENVEASKRLKLAEAAEHEEENTKAAQLMTISSSSLSSSDFNVPAPACPCGIVCEMPISHNWPMRDGDDFNAIVFKKIFANFSFLELLKVARTSKAFHAMAKSLPFDWQGGKPTEAQTKWLMHNYHYELNPVIGWLNSGERWAFKINDIFKRHTRFEDALAEIMVIVKQCEDPVDTFKRIVGKYCDVPAGLRFEEIPALNQNYGQRIESKLTPLQNLHNYLEAEKARRVNEKAGPLECSSINEQAKEYNAQLDHFVHCINLARPYALASCIRKNLSPPNSLPSYQGSPLAKLEGLIANHYLDKRLVEQMLLGNLSDEVEDANFASQLAIDHSLRESAPTIVSYTRYGWTRQVSWVHGAFLRHIKEAGSGHLGILKTERITARTLRLEELYLASLIRHLKLLRTVSPTSSKAYQDNLGYFSTFLVDRAQIYIDAKEQLIDADVKQAVADRPNELWQIGIDAGCDAITLSHRIKCAYCAKDIPRSKELSLKVCEFSAKSAEAAEKILNHAAAREAVGYGQALRDRQTKLPAILLGCMSANSSYGRKYQAIPQLKTAAHYYDLLQNHLSCRWRALEPEDHGRLARLGICTYIALAEEHLKVGARQQAIEYCEKGAEAINAQLGPIAAYKKVHTYQLEIGFHTPKLIAALDAALDLCNHLPEAQSLAERSAALIADLSTRAVSPVMGPDSDKEC